MEKKNIPFLRERGRVFLWMYRKKKGLFRRKKLSCGRKKKRGETENWAGEFERHSPLAAGGGGTSRATHVSQKDRQAVLPEREKKGTTAPETIKEGVIIEPNVLREKKKAPDEVQGREGVNKTSCCG